jgi:dTDP-4-dehydrorhamnose 3,5-epimerase
MKSKESQMPPATEYQLPGMKTYDIQKHPDERGFFAEVLRADWKEFLEGEWVVQANLSLSYPGIIRAWHRHARGQIDYFLVLQGALKIVAYDEARGRLAEVIASEERLQLVRVPGGYWHGTKSVGHQPSRALYFVTRLYDYANPDEERRPWNDARIIDPRTQQAYDWNRPPHK